MRSWIKEALEEDIEIPVILSGGIHAAQQISREKTPAAFDSNDELLPCALVKLPSTVTAGPDENSERQFLDIYLYERDGFVNIDAVLPLIFTLFHRVKVGEVSQKAFEARWVGDTTDVEDQALEVSMAVSRFEIARYRG